MTCRLALAAHDGSNVRARVLIGELPRDWQRVRGAPVREMVCCDGCASALTSMGYDVRDERRSPDRPLAFPRLRLRRAAA